MNRNDLISQSQLNIKTLNEVLEGLGISKNLEDFTDEHLKLVQTIQEIRKDEKVQSWSEAIAIYRKPIREAQLKEITVRCAIPDERIPEILAAMKLKLETLTDPQIELFGKVCMMVQSRMDLTLAAQAVLGEAKAAKTKKSMPEFVAQAADENAGGGAIALTTPSSITTLEISEADRATLRDIAEAAAAAASTVDISDKAAELAVKVVDQIDAVLLQMIIESIFGGTSHAKPDPGRAAARVREIRVQRGEE